MCLTRILRDLGELVCGETTGFEKEMRGTATASASRIPQHFRKTSWDYLLHTTVNLSIDFLQKAECRGHGTLAAKSA